MKEAKDVKKMYESDLMLSDKDVNVLCMAICTMAAQDYRTGFRMEKRRGAKARKLSEKKDRGYTLSEAESRYLREYEYAVYHMAHAKNFFEGQWGYAVSGVDGKSFLEKLERTENLGF